MESSNFKVIHNAKVYEGRGKFSQALCIEGGRIAKTGGNAEMLESVPAGAEKIDAAGSLVIPAFNDSHLHMLWLGRREGMIEGAGALSVEDVLQRGRDLIARLKPKPGTYVQGAGVNPDLFSGEKRDLNRNDLDKISTIHPIIISRHCGHTIYCNSLALKMAGLDKSAPQVEGGTFEKDADGRLTGVLRENANALARKPIPALGKNEIRDKLRLAMKKALSLGIASVGSCDIGGPDFDDIAGVYREIYAEGWPRVRVTMQCGISDREDMLAGYIERGFITGKVLYETPELGPLLKMGPVKLFLDGTLGGQTAWMREPYKDKPETSGFAVMEEALFRGFVRKAAEGKIQVVVHAIGDAALNAVVSAFEQVTSPGNNPLRHGVVHCQVSRHGDLERMARNNILALVQPVFLADDMHILESRVGLELASTSYAWGSMERLGIKAGYGTDAPVSDLNPLLGISWAVNRRDPLTGMPRNGFYPAENVGVSAAVDAYTSGSAYTAFSENYLGYIKPGYIADLAFIDKDIFTIPAEDIHKAKVTRTMLAGNTVWEN
jgi:predicted amidohydrolase YtcJ